MKLLLCIMIGFAHAVVYGQVKPLSKSAFDSAMQVARNCEGRAFHHFDTTALSGKQYTAKDLKGKVTFITFWFTDCKPCMEEIADLKALYQRYENTPDFLFLSFTVDMKERALGTVKKNQLPYPVLPISTELALQLNCMNGYPTHIVVKEDGTIAAKYTGLDIFGQPHFWTDIIYPKIDSLLAMRKP